jgi:hypothetical protein
LAVGTREYFLNAELVLKLAHIDSKRAGMTKTKYMGSKIIDFLPVMRRFSRHHLHPYQQKDQQISSLPFNSRSTAARV